MRVRIGWTTCALTWCLAVAASTDLRRLPLERRQGSGGDIGVATPPLSGSSIAPPTSAAAAASTAPPPSSSSSTITRPNVPAAPDAPPTSPPRPVPTPMDLTVSYSLSDGCLDFMTSFLTNPLFTTCLPLSLLLTTSTSYRNLVSAAPDDKYGTLNNLIAYTSSPQPSSTECDDYFASLAKAITEKKHCAADLNGGAEANPVAMDTRRGLGNYKVVREVSALKDPQSGEYCYLRALADSRPDDMYLYSLPAGIPLPRSSSPTCSPCSALLLNQFTSSLSSKPSSTLNSTLILDAVNTVNTACGGSLVAYNNVSIANAAATPRAAVVSVTLTVAALALLWRL